MEITIPIILLIGFLVFVSKPNSIMFNFGEINNYDKENQNGELKERKTLKKLLSKK